MSTVPAIPVIGSSGYFKLKSPFDTQIRTGEKYTCKSLRKISDYLADRKDVYKDIYSNNGLTEEDYSRDQQSDAIIVGLQSGIGHWVYVPISYVMSFPDINGVVYRGIGIVVALPPIPAEKSLDNIFESISNVIVDNLGVDPQFKTVELTKPVLIASEKHDELTLERDARKLDGTDRSKLIQAQKTIDELLFKVQELEGYIKRTKGL